MMKIDVVQVTGADTLVGKSAGKRDFPALAAAVLHGSAGEIVALDWSKVQLATASYFAEAVLPLVKMTYTGGLDRFFLFCGLNQNCKEELEMVLGPNSIVVLMANSTAPRELCSAKPFGHLDQVYLDTFKMVVQCDGASAAELFKQNQAEQIGKTAWVNRLTYLHGLRLLRKTKVGREFVFQSPAKVKVNG